MPVRTIATIPIAMSLNTMFAGLEGWGGVPRQNAQFIRKYYLTMLMMPEVAREYLTGVVIASTSTVHEHWEVYALSRQFTGDKADEDVGIYTCDERLNKWNRWFTNRITMGGVFSRFHLAWLIDLAKCWIGGAICFVTRCGVNSWFWDYNVGMVICLGI